MGEEKNEGTWEKEREYWVKQELHPITVVTLNTEGTERELVTFMLFSRQGNVTFLWTGGEVGERFLVSLLDRWGVDIAAARDDAPSREIYGCTAVRYGYWNQTKWMKLDKLFSFRT